MKSGFNYYQAERIDDIYDKAIFLFAEMARTQFFYDGNRRTARMIMNGVLLNEGYPMINVSATRKTEFNTVMIDCYNHAKSELVNTFLRSCLNKIIVQQFLTTTK